MGEATPPPAEDAGSAHAEPTSAAPALGGQPGHHVGSRTLPLALGALGIVFGDIGTSPLYAMQTVFSIEHNTVQATRGDVLRRHLDGAVVDHARGLHEVRRRWPCAPTTTARAASSRSWRCCAATCRAPDGSLR